MVTFFYFCLVRPNESKVVNVLSIMDHVIFMLILLFISLIYGVQGNKLVISHAEYDTVQVYSLWVVILGITLIVVNFIYILVMTIKGIYENRKEFKDQVKKVFSVIKRVMMCLCRCHSR